MTRHDADLPSLRKLWWQHPLFCGAGGAAKGLQRAGFYVAGVDIVPQPHYCGDEFYQADAMTFPLDGYDAYWASPPCQGYSVMRHLPWLRDKDYPLTTKQLTLDLGAGTEAKKNALASFEVRAADWLALARKTARDICRDQGTVTSDDILGEIGMPEGLHHNVVGAIFASGEFIRVGFRRTRRPQGHARMIGVWSRKGK